MKAVVTRHSPAKPKPFAWSYSKLKNFESCPKRHWHVDIAKDVKEEEGEALLWGNEVHRYLARRIAQGEALPAGMQKFEKWCAPIATPGSTVMVEQKFAITRNFEKCSWFSDDAWYRGIADVLKLAGPVALAVDWKTGRIVEESQQLALMAACVFAHHPDIMKIRTEFIWLKEDATSRLDFERDEMAQMWRNLWPRIEQLEHAHDTMTYPAKKGGLCKRYCPVSSCPHHGE